MLAFPGDAQWGTWHAALTEPRWQSLLRRTAVLKVGHHGSHNASPRDLIDDVLPDDIFAMVSVGRIDRWPRIPKQELLEALAAKRIAVARSDRSDDVGAPFRAGRDGRWIEPEFG